MCFISTDENTYMSKTITVCKCNESNIAIFLPKAEQVGEMAFFQLILLLLLKNLPYYMHIHIDLQGKSGLGLGFGRLYTGLGYIYTGIYIQYSIMIFHAFYDLLKEHFLHAMVTYLFVYGSLSSRILDL